MDPKKILFVSYEEFERQNLQEHLVKHGFEWVEVNNGEAALMLLAKMTFDLILLDPMLPRIRGMELVRNVIQLAPNTRLILMTANADAEVAVQALRYRVYDYFIKPVRLEQLEKSILTALNTPVEVEVRILEHTEVKTRPRRYDLPNGGEVDINRRMISLGKKTVQLSPGETLLLEALLYKKNQAVPAVNLVRYIHGYEVAPNEASQILRPLISRLRAKLAAFPEPIGSIRNSRGVGYIYDTEEDIP